MTHVPGMRTESTESATRARIEFLEHGPRDDGTCRTCGKAWKCQSHLDAEKWLFPAKTLENISGRGQLTTRQRPRPNHRLATSTMVAADEYPYIETGHFRTVTGSDAHPEVHNYREIRL